MAELIKSAGSRSARRCRPGSLHDHIDNFHSVIFGLVPNDLWRNSEFGSDLLNLVK